MRFDLIVFGEVLVDHFADAAVVGGAPFNVARHLAALGLKPLMISRVGTDADGQRITNEVARYGLSGQGLQTDPQRGSGAVKVQQNPAGEHRFEILPDRAYDHIDAATALAAAGTAIALPIYFGSLGQRGKASRQALADLRAAEKGASYFDLNWREGHCDFAYAKELLESADTIKLNEAELEMVLGWYGIAQPTMPLRMPPAEDSVRHCLAALMQRLSAARLVVTLGPAGYAAFNCDGRCIAAGAASPAATMRDTVGAGDAFSAIVLLGLCLNWPLATSLARASDFAAAICGERGAAPADLQFYGQWRRAWGIAHSGSASLQSARLATGNPSVSFGATSPTKVGEARAVSPLRE